MTLLNQILSPRDLRVLPVDKLPALADEIRSRIVEVVGRNGGHLASNLGLVELSIALHRCLDTPNDRLLFDVGHQCYPHKLLTGRAGQMTSLRQRGGLSGYPNPRESLYDLFQTGHAGTSVSTILGLAVADQKTGRHAKAVAVVGDGAMTSGMVFEALNHAGQLKLDLLVILNDNGCSISPTTGALSATCSDIRATHLFKQVREKGREFLEKIPYVGRNVERLAEGVLQAASRVTHAPGALFLDLGFGYFGPVDGHDLAALEKWLAQLKDSRGPKLLHVVTHKGYGLPWAASDPITWHGARPYTVQGDTAVFNTQDPNAVPVAPSYTQVVSETLVEIGRAHV